MDATLDTSSTKPKEALILTNSMLNSCTKLVPSSPERGRYCWFCLRLFPNWGHFGSRGLEETQSDSCHIWRHLPIGDQDGQLRQPRANPDGCAAKVRFLKECAIAFSQHLLHSVMQLLDLHQSPWSSPLCMSHVAALDCATHLIPLMPCRGHMRVQLQMKTDTTIFWLP